jgi:hypothetical protein
MELDAIPRLSSNSFFGPWDRGLHAYLASRNLEAWITPTAPPEPYRLPRDLGTASREGGHGGDSTGFAGKSVPAGYEIDADNSSATLSDDQRREWIAWARSELLTRQAILKTLDSALVLEFEACWSSQELYAALHRRFTNNRAHRSLVWRIMRMRLADGARTPDGLRAHLAAFRDLVDEFGAIGRPRDEEQVCAHFVASLPDDLGWPIVAAVQALPPHRQGWAALSAFYLAAAAEMDGMRRPGAFKHKSMGTTGHARRGSRARRSVGTTQPWPPLELQLSISQAQAQGQVRGGGPWLSKRSTSTASAASAASAASTSSTASTTTGPVSATHTTLPTPVGTPVSTQTRAAAGDTPKTRPTTPGMCDHNNPTPTRAKPAKALQTPPTTPPSSA